jgi:acetyltransferase-like isoleucine patch superfamily enzyme
MPKSLKNYIRLTANKFLLKFKGVVIHNNTTFSNVNFNGKAVIEPYCRLVGDPKITVGNDFYLNSNCHLLGEIIIGNNVMIGPKTVIWGRDHGMEIGLPMQNQKHIKSPIVIEDDVWIGANVTILKGVTLHSGSVIAAGSVVVKDVPKNNVVAGNPAKTIKIRE